MVRSHPRNKKSSNGKKNPWALAVKQAYANLKREGEICKGEFVPLKRGGQLYKEAVRIRSGRKRSCKSPKCSKRRC